MERLSHQRLASLCGRMAGCSSMFKCSAFLLAWSLSVIAFFEYKQSPLRAEQLRQTEEILRTQQLMQELLARNSDLQEQVHSLRGTPSLESGETKQMLGRSREKLVGTIEQMPTRSSKLDTAESKQSALLPASSLASFRADPLLDLPPTRKLGGSYRGIADAASNSATSGCLTFNAAAFGFDLSILACSNSARCPLCFISLHGGLTSVLTLAYCSTARRGAGSAAPSIGSGEAVEITIVNAGTGPLTVNSYNGGTVSGSGTSLFAGSGGSSTARVSNLASEKMVTCFCREGGSDALYCTA